MSSLLVSYAVLTNFLWFSGKLVPDLAACYFSFLMVAVRPLRLFLLDQTSQATQQASAELRSVLISLGYWSEIQSLDAFGKQFAEYRMLDRDVLQLAVENSAPLVAATGALDRFMAQHAEVVALSRRNSNVRSLRALAWTEAHAGRDLRRYAPDASGCTRHA